MTNLFTVQLHVRFYVWTTIQQIILTLTFERLHDVVHQFAPR